MSFSSEIFFHVLTMQYLCGIYILIQSIYNVSSRCFSCSYKLYMLIFDLDVDECADGYGNCQHTCSNTAGSYKCSCNNGYRLKDDDHLCEGTELITNGVCEKPK